MSYIDKMTGLVRPGTAETGGNSGGGEPLDLSFVTATTDDILSGKVGANSEGKPVNGSIQEMANPTVSANVVTIGKGYNPSQKTATVPKADEPTVEGNVVTLYAGYTEPQTVEVDIPVAQEPTVSGNVVTVYQGYLAAGKELTVGTAKSAATITPGTSDQTIAAGTYISGKQTIKGDADLKASNIKKGVSIFNVTGSYEVPPFDLAKVTKTTPYLKGVRATGYAGGEWAFDAEEKTFTGYEKSPKEGCVYASVAGRLIGNAIAFAGDLPADGLVFYDPLDGKNPNVPLIGLAYTETEVPTGNYTTFKGVPCALFDSGNWLKSTNCGYLPANNLTLSIWVHTKGDRAPGNFFGYGRDESYKVCMLRSDGDSSGLLGIERGSGKIYSEVTLMDQQWHHCVCTLGANGTNAIWLDGVTVLNFTQQFNLGTEKLSIGAWLNSANEIPTYYASARIYNRVLSAAEISALASEFAS